MNQIEEEIKLLRKPEDAARQNWEKADATAKNCR